MADDLLRNMPQHAKVEAVKDEMQAVGDFLEHLADADYDITDDEGENIMPLVYGTQWIERVLCWHFDIDHSAYMQEKDQLLEYVRSQNDRRAAD